jgi:hypothetical protein
MASTCSRVSCDGGLSALLFSASLFSALALQLLFLAVSRIDEISKKGSWGVDKNYGGQRDSQLRFYYIILRVVCVR